MKRECYRSGEKALTPSQVGVLLGSITDLRDEALLSLTLSTGMRREDVVNVKRADVDVDKCEVIFYESKKRRTRTVPIQRSTAVVLSKWLRLSSGKFLFPSERKSSKSGHLCSRAAYNVLQACLVRAGLPQRPFHALRASCSKLCQARGWSVEQTAKLLGDRVSTVQQHYTVPSDEELKEVAREKELF